MNYLLLSEHKPNSDTNLALWWAPNEQGYTIDINGAGRYGKRHAEDIVRRGQATMIPVPEAKKLARKVVIYGDIPLQHRPARRR